MLRVLASGFLIISALNSSGQVPLTVKKLTAPLVFDGVPDEEAWNSSEPLKMVMYMPVFGKEPTETSVIRLGYDDEFFYVSGILNYSNISDIRPVARKRDYSSPDCDWFGIVLDTYNDRKNAVAFWTNPNGIRSDGTVRNDMADSENDISFNWDTFWDVKTSITDKGWSAEMRIPFSSLRFQTENGKTLMGITIGWYLPAKYEMNTFPAVPPDFPAAYWKPSLTTLIEFSGLRPRKPVYIAPYITAGVGQVNELNDEGTKYKMKTNRKFDAGLDVKLSLSNNLTLDLTANTDFAQVEADDQKINLTRYSLYFPEKRSFFQEKSDVFDFTFHGANNLFYSRMIGLYDENPVRIYGGARLTGRLGKWDIGILDLQTEKFEDNPGENFGVMRTKRTIINQDSYIGGILTSRLGMNGNYNMAYGIDGEIRITGDEYFSFKWAQTFENDSLNRLLDLSPAKYLMRWQHRNERGFGYDVLYTASGKRYKPGIGFEQLDNYYGFASIIQYGWLPGDSSSIRYQKLSLSTTNIWNSITGSEETLKNAFLWTFEAKDGFYGYAGLTHSYEVLNDSLALGNDQAFVPPGRYSFLSLTASYSTSSKHALSTTFTTESGKFYDGWKVSLYASPKLNIGSGTYFGLTYNMDYVSFPSRSVSFVNHIAGLKAMFTLTTKISILSFIQYNTSVNKISGNFRFRYNPGEGNDFYLVYDEGLNTSLMRETPNLPVSSARTILLKYTYTFRF